MLPYPFCSVYSSFSHVFSHCLQWQDMDLKPSNHLALSSVISAPDEESIGCQNKGQYDGPIQFTFNSLREQEMINASTPTNKQHTVWRETSNDNYWLLILFLLVIIKLSSLIPILWKTQSYNVKPLLDWSVGVIASFGCGGTPPGIQLRVGCFSPYRTKLPENKCLH